MMVLGILQAAGSRWSRPEEMTVSGLLPWLIVCDFHDNVIPVDVCVATCFSPMSRSIC